MGKEAKRKPATELILSLVAIFVAVAALVISIVDAHETRQFNRYSVKPVLQFEVLNTPYDHRPQLGIFLSNHGNGLALLTGVTVMVDGQAATGVYSEGFAAVARQVGLLDNTDFPGTYVTTLPNSLAPGDSWCLFGLDSEAATPERIIVLRKAMDRIAIFVEYKSLYEEVFRVKMDAGERRNVTSNE